MGLRVRLMLFLTAEQEQTADRIHQQYGIPLFIADTLAALPYCDRCGDKLRAGRKRWWCRNHPHTIHPECR